MGTDLSPGRKPARPIKALIRAAAERLAAAGVAEPQRDARWLMRWAAGLDGAGLSAAEDAPVDVDAAQRFEAAVAERAARRPLSQIVGGRAFHARWFEVDETVLDPRPESELLVVAAVELLAPDAPARVLDLGVGSGCLLLSVLAERAEATGLGVDCETAALEVAGRNAARLGLEERVELRLGDWLEGVDERFDAILCNPPYVPTGEMADLAPEPRLYEPASALTPGADGLAAYRLLAPRIAAKLTPEGAALFEVGRDQGRDVAALFQAAGLDVALRRDLAGVERMVVARPRRNG